MMRWKSSCLVPGHHDSASLARGFFVRPHAIDGDGRILSTMLTALQRAGWIG